jgi:hypothetical protein
MSEIAKEVKTLLIKESENIKSKNKKLRKNKKSRKN